MRALCRLIPVNVVLASALVACMDQATNPADAPAGQWHSVARFTTSGPIQFSLQGFTTGPNGQITTSPAGPFKTTATGNALIGGGETPISWGIQTATAPNLYTPPESTYNGGDLAVVATVNGKRTVLALVNANLTDVATFTVAAGVPLELDANIANSSWVFQGWSFNGMTAPVSTASPYFYTTQGGNAIFGQFAAAVPSGGGGGGGGGGGCGTQIIC